MKIVMIAVVLVSGFAVNAFAGDGNGGQEGNKKRVLILSGEANGKPESGGSGGETNALPAGTGASSGGNM